MKCQVCASIADAAFAKRVLYKYDVTYFRCGACELLFTEKPYWLEEAYDERLMGIRDTGMVQRNLLVADAIALLASEHFDPDGAFVDYGAGTGLLVRLMRDRGFNFLYFDPLARNVFARGIDVTSRAAPDRRHEFVTAIEVFEHSADPLADVSRMLSYSDSIVFTTELQPLESQALEAWSYLFPEAGQHVSFYSLRTLRALAAKFSLELYTDNRQFHLLTRKRLNLRWDQLEIMRTTLMARVARRLIRVLQGPTGLGVRRGSYVSQDLVDVSRRLGLLDDGGGSSP